MIRTISGLRKAGERLNIILDLLLLLIVALCIWDGYKRGLIGGIAGIFAIIIALLAGSSLSDNYASEAVPVLEPFVDGYIDSQKTRSAVLEEMGYGSTDLSLEDVLESDSVVSILCDTITYVMGLALCFLLILILLVAISNIGGLVFRLPDSMELLDELGGALMGFVKGFLYCVLLCWLLSFLGLIIGRGTLEKTLLARFFMTFRFLTNGLL